MNQVQVIEVSDPTQITEVLKVEISKVLSESTKELMESLPKKEDYKTESEYDLMKRMAMIDMIDKTKELKHEIFKQILNNYNNLLDEIIKFKNLSATENKNLELMDSYLDQRVKRTLILSLGISLFFPSIIPIIIMVDIPEIGSNRLLKKVYRARLENNKKIKNTMEQVQEPLYEFSDILRTDYHKSNEELKELEHKAIIGEDISENIKELLNPERIGLKRIENDNQLDNQTTKEKILVKRKSKQN